MVCTCSPIFILVWYSGIFCLVRYYRNRNIGTTIGSAHLCCYLIELYYMYSLTDICLCSLVDICCITDLRIRWSTGICCLTDLHLHYTAELRYMADIDLHYLSDIRDQSISFSTNWRLLPKLSKIHLLQLHVSSLSLLLGWTWLPADLPYYVSPLWIGQISILLLTDLPPVLGSFPLSTYWYPPSTYPTSPSSICQISTLSTLHSLHYTPLPGRSPPSTWLMPPSPFWSLPPTDWSSPSTWLISNPLHWSQSSARRISTFFLTDVAHLPDRSPPSTWLTSRLHLTVLHPLLGWSSSSPWIISSLLPDWYPPSTRLITSLYPVALLFHSLPGWFRPGVRPALAPETWGSLPWADPAPYSRLLDHFMYQHF